MSPVKIFFRLVLEQIIWFSLQELPEIIIKKKGETK